MHRYGAREMLCQLSLPKFLAIINTSLPGLLVETTYQSQPQQNIVQVRIGRNDIVDYMRYFASLGEWDGGAGCRDATCTCP